MHDGFVDRARAVTRTLSDKRTTFLVVSTLEPSPVRETEFFVDALSDRKLHLGAVVLNKVLPDWFGDRGASDVAKRLSSDAPAVAATLADVGPPDQVARVLVEVADSFLNFQVVATREAEQRAELAAGPDVVATVPYADHDITDLPGLLELGESLWRQRA
jgi:anion-transporting  ArsA/GET3 family ATPase